MSCEIKHIAQILDIHQCKQLISEKSECHENWLQACLISFSPTGEILTIAKGNKLMVFTPKWDNTESGDIKIKYSINWQGNLCTESGEITSILCLPLVSHGQSASGPNWTCIVIGFSSGSIKFYTENMHQLISEVLHAEPIMQIKCHSFKKYKQQANINSSDQESNELICVLYKSVMCVISGASLYQTLQSCRNQLACHQADEQLTTLNLNLPIDLKKYSFDNQDAITDASFIGQTSVNIFDHLVTASLSGGFNSNYSPSPTQSSLLIATGRKPFLGFHYTRENNENPELSDVALAVANKIKDSMEATLMAWFGIGNRSTSEEEKNKVSREPVEHLICRFGLYDLWRNGNSIVTTPDGKFSAVTDSLGRIFLIENYNGIARRLWKGYRGAQCGFLLAQEDIEKRGHKKMETESERNSIIRRALFIIIYAPKKGLIEIFNALQGPCIASYKVSKNGRLIYNSYGLLGFNNQVSKNVTTNQFPVVYLSEDGIKEIVVPFHCCLRSDNSNKVRDLHIFKKMKALLKENHNMNDLTFNENMKGFAKDLKTDEIKMHVIEMLISNKQITVEAFMDVLKVFIDGFQIQDNAEHSKSYILFFETLEKLLAFYVFVKELNDQPPNYNSLVDSSEKDDLLAEILLLSNKELLSVLKLINEIKHIKCEKSKVTFKEQKEKSLSYFLSCLDFNSFINFSPKLEKEEKPYLTFKTDLNEEKMKWIGEFLFSGIFYSDKWINDWKTHASESKMDCIALAKCFISYWLNKNVSENFSYEILSLVELLKTICSLADPHTIEIEYNKPSPWWKSIRNYLKSSRCSVASFLAAVACRAVTISMEQMKELRQASLGNKITDISDSPAEELKNNSPSRNNEWESVSQDTWEWDILIMKLEDVALLNAILNVNLKKNETLLAQLDFEFIDLSLDSILMKGNGYISELVAKWLAQFGLDPSKLIDLKDVEFKIKNSSLSETNVTENNDTMEIKEAKILSENETDSFVLDYLALLKEKFPYSLTSSTLLSNICWEYMVHWYRKNNDLNSLESAICYLQTIPSISIKCGMAYLCWTTYVKHTFSAIAELIDKFGKPSLNKFCVGEINLTNLQIPAFFKLSTELLKIMLETNCDEKCEFIVNQEGIWANERIGKTPSLVTLALLQMKLNDELVGLHCQLSLSLYMMSELDIRIPKIFLALFGSAVSKKFFSDLTKESHMSSNSINSIYKKPRKQFLYKVITGAVETINIVEKIPLFPMTQASDYVPETCMNVERAIKLICNCFELAQMWNIPLDDLRRRYVCELYSYGFDRLAEEILPAVNDCNTLASQLLVLAGKRFKVYIQSSSNTNKFVRISPNLLQWLESLDASNLKNGNTELNDLSTLLTYIMNWQPTKVCETELARTLAESIPFFENDQIKS